MAIQKVEPEGNRFKPTKNQVEPVVPVVDPKPKDEVVIPAAAAVGVPQEKGLLPAAAPGVLALLPNKPPPAAGAAAARTNEAAGAAATGVGGATLADEK